MMVVFLVLTAVVWYPAATGASHHACARSLGTLEEAAERVRSSNFMGFDLNNFGLLFLMSRISFRSMIYIVS